MRVDLGLPLVVTLATLTLVTHETSASLPSIQDVFSRLWMSRQEEQPIREEQPKSRAKRQNPGIGDQSTLPYEVITSDLPMWNDTHVNDRYMPVLGSGYVSATVYSDKMYINNLFNGNGPDSHRAVIPALVMTRTTLNDPSLESQTTRKFTFNVQEGVFSERISNSRMEVIQQTYIHQKYVRCLITSVQSRKVSNYAAKIYFNYPDERDSPDLTVTASEDHNGHHKVRAETIEAEDGAAKQKVYAYYTDTYSDFVLTPSWFYITNVMCVDTIDSNAQADFDNIMNLLNRINGHEDVLKEHKEAWAKTWSQGLIEVVGDNKLAKITRFAQYYLMSSLPPMFANQPPQYNQVYNGYARTSLGKGAKGRDYQGHMFWDSEMYIFPAVLAMHPNLAKLMLRYRSAHALEAENHAKDMGKEGYRFPWESAFIGNEVTPDTCTTCKEQQMHVSGAVSWAFRQYWSATRDQDFKTNPDYQSCDMTREIGRFYASLAEYDSEEGRYDIKNVIGPDDWHPGVNNNAYTNVMASLALHWATYYACECNANQVPDDWIQKALYLKLPFDNVKRLHYQYDGYETETNRTVKQADTILLTYPVYWNMSTDIMRNDLEYYEQYTDARTPAMTWSFFVVGWKWVNENTKMLSYFQKSYQDYLIDPFKIWTEYNEANVQDQMDGSVNFLPGQGAFLQSLIYGFAGIRYRPEFLEFHNPIPPPDCDSLTLRSFNYLGVSMDIMVFQDKVEIYVEEVLEYELILLRNNTQQEERLTIGATVVIDNPRGGFFLYPTRGSSCEHPRDYIYMPWGYSPWISGAISHHQPITVLLSSVVALILLYAIRNYLR